MAHRALLVGAHAASAVVQPGPASTGPHCRDGVRVQARDHGGRRRHAGRWEGAHAQDAARARAGDGERGEATPHGRFTSACGGRSRAVRHCGRHGCPVRCRGGTDAFGQRQAARRSRTGTDTARLRHATRASATGADGCCRASAPRNGRQLPVPNVARNVRRPRMAAASYGYAHGCPAHVAAYRDTHHAFPCARLQRRCNILTLGCRLAELCVMFFQLLK